MSTLAAKVGNVGPVMLKNIPIEILAPTMHAINNLVAVSAFI
jgi:hypothetical protein